MRKAMVLVVIGLAGTFASPAFAEDDFKGFRLGMNLNSDQLEGDFAFQGLGVQPVNNNRFGYGLFGGWGFNKYFAVEGGLRMGGKFNTDARFFVGSVPNVAPVLPDTFDDAPYFKVSNKISSLDASVVGSFWIGEKFSIFGRLGGMYWDAETRYAYGDVDGSGLKTFDEIGDTGAAPMGGIGLQTVLDGALMRVEYQYVDLGDLPVGSYFGQFENVMESVSFSIVWTLR